MDDCEVDGEYCRFHNRFLDLLKSLEAKPWFSNFVHPTEKNYVFHKGRYKESDKIAEFFEVNFILIHKTV